jgi:cytochrome c553
VKKLLALAVPLSLVAFLALAAPAGDELAQALKFKGDIKAGKESYFFCVKCHLPSGAGRNDGTIPQLAGQHTTVLIKQIADIRAGARDNSTMHPLAKELADAQELADIAAFIESLCIPPDHGRYEGKDAEKRIADGKILYEKDCVDCHQANGEGVKDKLYPALAGQHYKYLLRQMTETRDGKRRNASPEMAKVIAPYSNDQLISVSAYQASLSMPGLMCPIAAPGAAKKK